MLGVWQRWVKYSVSILIILRGHISLVKWGGPGERWHEERSTTDGQYSGLSIDCLIRVYARRWKERIALRKAVANAVDGGLHNRAAAKPSAWPSAPRLTRASYIGRCRTSKKAAPSRLQRRLEKPQRSVRRQRGAWRDSRRVCHRRSPASQPE